MFAISVSSLVGDGRTTLFWKDRWLHGKSIEELAPALVPFVNKRARSRRTVNKAMQDLRWVGDIAGGLSVPAILDYLELWDTLENVQLLENQPDQHLWTPESSGTYSARSAYARFFVGSFGFEPYKRLWKSWAPLRCKIFLWLAMLNRCWTADRLARQGLQHPDKVPPLRSRGGESPTHSHILRFRKTGLDDRPWEGRPTAPGPHFGVRHLQRLVEMGSTKGAEGG